MTINDRIKALRKLMSQHNIDAYIIPSSDPHQSEYVAEYWKSRQWISGFSGSAGTVVITQDHADVWTDVRYYLQAEIELNGTDARLQRQKTQGAPEHIDWLCTNLAGKNVGCDGSLFSIDAIRALEKAFYAYDITLNHSLDLISPIWENRPTLPQNPIFEHPIKYAGRSCAEKLAQIRKQMAAQNADYHLVATLDDIAWIFNIRSNDVECNPVSIAYCVIDEQQAWLFIERSKVPEGIRRKLVKDGVILKAYEDIEKFLSKISNDKCILLDSSAINIRLHSAINAKVKYATNIPMMLKAVKNEIEIRHIKEVMVKDGVALLRLYRWLEETLKTRTIKETEVATQLDAFRREQGNYFGESFSAIVGYKANGAIIHYHPQEATCADIKPEGILLLDSGGQYINGTTDITRTTALGIPTAEQKRHFTLVLKGHIALAKLVFPHGTKGVQMDTMARQFLWQNSLNYGHGTGHGVGFFLSVHEPPQGFITSFGQRGVTVMEPGMLSSNEPGFYKNGDYGIRIENLVVCVEHEQNEYGKFLKYDTVTLFPIDQNLMDTSLMDKQEKDWLNNYHKTVYQKLSPKLSVAERAWLREKTKRIK